MDDKLELPDQLTTNRLILRPFCSEDLEPLAELHTHESVTQFLGGDGRPRSRSKSQEWLDKALTCRSQQRPAQYVVLDRASGEWIGRCGLNDLEISQPSGAALPVATWGQGSAVGASVDRLLEVGYVIHPRHQRKGFATEAANAWIHWVFEQLDREMLVSIIHGDNEASQRVAVKNNLRPGAWVLLDDQRFRLFELHRVDWKPDP